MCRHKKTFPDRSFGRLSNAIQFCGEENFLRFFFSFDFGFVARRAEKEKSENSDLKNKKREKEVA
jgi:hypothetical protein